MLTEQLPIGVDLAVRRASTRRHPGPHPHRRVDRRRAARRHAPTPHPVRTSCFEAGDLVVTVGTRDGLDQVAHILDGTDGSAAPPGDG